MLDTVNQRCVPDFPHALVGSARLRIDGTGRDTGVQLPRGSDLEMNTF